MEILQLIVHKLHNLGITMDEEDVEIILSEVDQCIKNYCHINCIPQELLYTRCNLVIDYIQYLNANKPSENGGADVSNGKIGPLTSVKAGNITYQFADNTNNKGAIHNAHIADLDVLINNYTYQLNNFRRLV